MLDTAGKLHRGLLAIAGLKPEFLPYGESLNLKRNRNRQSTLNILWCFGDDSIGGKGRFGADEVIFLGEVFQTEHRLPIIRFEAEVGV